MTRPAILVFAAGFGTRMGALTRDRPKPLVTVAGRALLDHALDLATGAQISRIVVNIHYKGDMIRDHLATRPDIRISDETDAILETGGGLRQALPLLGPGPVFTLNSDAIWQGPNPLHILHSAWDPASMDALLLLIDQSRAVGHTGPGDFGIDGAGRLSRGGGYTYTGAQILCPDGVSDIPDRAFSLNRLWDRMLGTGRLCGVVYPGQWCDVGQPDSIPLAETMLKGRRDV